MTRITARARGNLGATIALAVCLAQPSGARGSDCSRTAVGLTPINDLGAGLYQGYVGGLYPGGANGRPTMHDVGADALARVALLDATGAPNAATGRIVMLTVGMSNTNLESNAFIPLANADPLKNSRLTIVNGAQGGWSASRVADPSQNAAFWSTIDQRLVQAGVTRAQVETVWLKEAEAGPTQAFPDDARILQSDLAEIARIIRSRYPSTRQVYVSSRIYAGYATTSLNPEPYAYQSGFAVKWLVADQIAGLPSLNFDPSRGVVQAPWLAWGPYTWADGLTPRSDGLIWRCDDLQSDGTHPSPSGSAKVAQALLYFFKVDPIASRWFADCDPGDTAAFSVPPRALDLVVAPAPAGGALELRWQDLAPFAGAGTVHDVVAGRVDTLATAGFGGAACVAAGVAGALLPDPIADPPPGEAIYYLVRGRNGCGPGTFDEPGAVAGPRQALDAASPCPGS